MAETKRPWLSRFRDGLRTAFALESPHGPLTAEDHDLLNRLARAIAIRRMATPAVLFLESVRPLNSLGSQTMVFLRPFLTPLFKPAEYDRMSQILERRESIAALIDAIEAARAMDRKLLS